MVKFVENELNSIREEVKQMWILVYEQLDNAYKAVLNLDTELANQVVSREKRVNAFELKIDSDVEDFLALYTPVAIDLRFCLAMLKINTNLERIGDYADSIARFVNRMDISIEERDEIFDRVNLREMYETVLKMLMTTYKALDTQDIMLAKSVFKSDDRLDQLNTDAVGVLTSYCTEHNDAIKGSLEIMGILRKLERAGDHINNLVEETIFYLDAKVLKHHNKLYLIESEKFE